MMKHGGEPAGHANFADLKFQSIIIKRFKSYVVCWHQQEDSDMAEPVGRQHSIDGVPSYMLARARALGNVTPLEIDDFILANAGRYLIFSLVGINYMQCNARCISFFFRATFFTPPPVISLTFFYSNNASSRTQIRMMDGGKQAPVFSRVGPPTSSYLRGGLHSKNAFTGVLTVH